MSIERYLLFTKFMMETVFSHMYVDPNLQRYRRAMSGRTRNRDGGRYIQKMVNSWLSAFVYSDFVCLLESIRVPLVARVPRVGTTALEGMANGKKVRGRRYQMIDNIMINGLYEDTKRKAEKRIEWRMLSFQ